MPLDAPFGAGGPRALPSAEAYACGKGHLIVPESLAASALNAEGSDGQLQGIFNGYGGGPDVGSVRTAPNDVVVFRSATSSMWSTPRDEIVDLMVKEIRQVTASTSRPAFIWAWVLNWAWSMDKLQEVQAQLGAEYVAVRPDVLAAMARAHG